LDLFIQEEATINKRSKSKQVNFVLEEHYAEKLAEKSERVKELS